MMTNGKWKGWGVSQIGPQHLKNGIPNQDAYIVRHYSTCLVCVVCDGLGSKPMSHFGSRALVKAVTQASRLFDFTKDLYLFETLLMSLWEISIYPLKKETVSTTLMFTIIKNNKIYIGRVGDGAIAVLGKKNFLIEEEQKGFTNLTHPFGSEDLDWTILNEDDVESIVMCTDGISEDIQDNRKIDFFNEYIEHYKNIFSKKRTRRIKKMLKDWPVKGHSDDKTILAITKVSDE